MLKSFEVFADNRFYNYNCLKRVNVIHLDKYFIAKNSKIIKIITNTFFVHTHTIDWVCEIV